MELKQRDVVYWDARGKNFSVEIVHWKVDYTGSDQGSHRWNIYAYIHPGHPLYEEESKSISYWETSIDFHGGATFKQFIVNEHISIVPAPKNKYGIESTYKSEEKITVKIGCDYSHLGDDEYSFASELPYQVEQDAKELYEFLSKGE